MHLLEHHQSKKTAAMQLETFKTLEQRKVQHQRVLNESLMVVRHRVAIRQLMMILAGMMRGEVGAVVATMRMNKADDMQDEVTRQARLQAALRQLRVILTNSMRGRKAGAWLSFVLNRRADLNSDKQADLESSATLSFLEEESAHAMMMEQCQRKARQEVEEIRSYMAHIDLIAKEELTEMQVALETQMHAQSHGAGLRALRQVMKRLVKGEVGMRVEIWYNAMEDERREAELRKHRAIQMSLHCHIRSQSQDSGLRILQQALKQVLHGELGLRIEIWYNGREDAVREIRMEAVANGVRAKQYSWGMWQLQRMLTAYMQGSFRKVIQKLRLRFKDHKRMRDLTALEADMNILLSAKLSQRDGRTSLLLERQRAEAEIEIHAAATETEKAQLQLRETAEKLEATSTELDRLLARHRATRDRQATTKMVEWLIKSGQALMRDAVHAMRQNKKGDVTLIRHTRATELLREAIGHVLPAWNVERKQMGLELLRTSLGDKVHEINRRARKARVQRSAGTAHVGKGIY